MTLTTGLAPLDKVLRGLIAGDNVVWQVGSVADYLPLVGPYCQAAGKLGQKLVYFRFAKHEPLVSEDSGAEIVELDPGGGFEQFVTSIHRVIERTGRGGYYIFDCLSDLAADWYSDRMLGNFFRLTCPYLYDVEAIAYFAILKNHHSVHASATIAETTQILLDVYRHHGKLYLHPIKVQQRHSPTMYMLHALDEDDLRPVTESAIISEILNEAPWAGAEPARTRMGVWNSAFLQAEKLLETQPDLVKSEEGHVLLRRLLRMIVTRDEQIHALAMRYFDLSDVLNIWRRSVGTGLIGGKSVGMLLARAILAKTDPRWNDLLETHDSFFIGSDVFYTYLVQNGCWWMRQKQHDPATFMENAEEARRRILTGNFPDDLRRQFSDMLDYFGQYPIIVRSSSLLEDAFGNSFAGKYESIFCPNQGSRDKRLEDFMSAVRTIYASTMSERALQYRTQRGILDRDEQMSLLVQRVSGSLHGHLYYPQVAGVGLSFNPYVWNQEIDPRAGMLRLVFGLGTRAVDRADDDYTRVVALNAPERRPEASFDEVRRYTQRQVDALDLAANRLLSSDFIDVAQVSHDLPLDVFASQDPELERLGAETGRGDMFSWILTFDRLLTQTSFPQNMRNMLETLERSYGTPVDVEFTANFTGDRDYRINLVQCRPLQVARDENDVSPPAGVAQPGVVMQTHGAVIGHGRVMGIDRIIYVAPATYGQLPIRDRYAIARLIGRLMHPEQPAPQPQRLLLLGPGRWGTSTPSLGVPVSFAEINRCAALCEIVAMRDDLVPDVSLGTHFFNELVECDILYTALFPTREGNLLNEGLLQKLPNRLVDLDPSSANRADVVHVIDAADLGKGETFVLHASNLSQQAICYIDKRR
jgi:hypothetical protein